MYTLPLCATHLAVLKRYATQNKIPLLAVQNAGYYGYFTIELPELFPVVETHPEQEAIADLRLLDPWPELSIFAANMTRDIDIQDDLEHGHLPFVVILLHYLERWKNDHGGCLPLKFAEKVAFRNMVARGARRDNPEGGEENFDEAVSAVMKHVCKPSLPANLEQIFEYREQAIVSGLDLSYACNALSPGCIVLPNGRSRIERANSPTRMRLMFVIGILGRPFLDYCWGH